MSKQYQIINCGSHVNPPPAMWAEYFEPAWRDRAPRSAIVAYPGEGDFEVLQLEGQNYRQTQSQIGVPTDLAYKLAHGIPFARSFLDGDDGQRNPQARLAAMDRDQIDADVVVHPGWPALNPKDLNLRWQLTRAFNSWLIDFCSVSPDRLIGIAELPTWDVGLAVAEVEYVAAKGLRGVMMPAIPGYVGNWSTPAEGSYNDPKWNPLWTVLDRLKLPIIVHADAAAATPELRDYGSAGINLIINKTLPQEMIASMIVGRVFERYPNLTVVCVETGVGWMAHLVSWMDLISEKHPYLFRGLTEKPSETFHRHIFGSFLWDTIGIASRDLIGIDNMMWCNDYPHDYGPWPNSLNQINIDLKDLNAADRHKVLAGNAMRVFGLQSLRGHRSTSD